MFTTEDNSHKPVKKPDWRALNAEYESSSETINEFCLRQGVNVSTFKENRKKHSNRKRQVSQNSFMPVSVEPLPQASNIVELQFSSGLKLTIQG